MMTRRLLPSPGWVILTIVIAGLAAVGTWSLSIFLSPTSASPARAAALATAVNGSVSSELPVNVSVEWKQQSIAINQASGIVTTVNVGGTTLTQPGDVLYTVNLRPVVVGVGRIPAFRSIAPGDVGDDVAQLQSLLSVAGAYGGPIDGKAGPYTVIAIRRWQATVGYPATGAVELGDVVFVDTLPSVIGLDPEIIVRGARLAGGERGVVELGTEPVFKLSVESSQASSIPTRSEVKIDGDPSGPWIAETGTSSQDPDVRNVTNIQLVGRDAASICAPECSTISPSSPTLLSSLVILQPKVSGVVIPSSALLTDASGRTRVRIATGPLRNVTVKAIAKGQAVITGVAVGTKVRLPK